ncbi:TPA: fimbrial protein [Escherichia coli]|nr:fimbrial protein [Escherichia coli]HAW3384604.1 fimbrial protein [Escherichia coli]
MKKLMVASAIAMSLMAGSAMASQGDVQFFGNVTAITCDVAPEVGGNVTNLVQLGTVAPQGLGDEIDIAFKATNPAGGNCTALNGKTASFAWSGNLITEGIGAQGGLAQDAHVILKPVNGNTTDAISSANAVVTFNAEEAIAEGFQFTAQLKGGDILGDFQSAAAYAVTYQ